jgi:L-fuconate dehydratase
VGQLGTRWHGWANEGQLRWLGPQKGVVHLALAALVGAVMDLWARHRQVPLWQGLAEMDAGQIADLIDFSTIEDYLSREEAIDLLESRPLDPAAIEAQLDRGYPAYDTSVGWLGYDDEVLVANVLASRERGYGAVKIKVGSPDLVTDVRRLAAVRDALGSEALVMIDANQIWGADEAVRAGQALAEFAPFWFEEPVHPDDLAGYLFVGKRLAPMRIAGGEHIPNQVIFKNFLKHAALHVAQPDVVRLGGLPEYLAVALMAAKAGVTVLPHAGDMGQVHQHLIYFTRCRLGMPELPLEMIPHLAEHFVEPCVIEGGRYVTPRAPGSSTRIKPESIRRFAWTPDGHPGAAG